MECCKNLDKKDGQQARWWWATQLEERYERAAAGGFTCRYSIFSQLLYWYCQRRTWNVHIFRAWRPTACLLKETDSSMPTGQTTIIDDEDDLPDSWDALYSCAQLHRVCWFEMTCTIDHTFLNKSVWFLPNPALKSIALRIPSHGPR